MEGVLGDLGRVIYLERNGHMTYGIWIWFELLMDEGRSG